MCGPGPHDGVDFVDEEDRAAVVAQFVEELLHPLLEFAPELRPGDQRRDVECEEAFVGDRVGDFAPCDAQGESLDDRALAHTGLADEHRVVLLAPREDLYHALDLGVASYDGVDLPFAGQAREVRPELFEQGVLFGGFVLLVEIEEVDDRDFGAEVVSHGEFPQVPGNGFGIHAVHLQHPGGCRRAVFGDPLQGVGRGYAFGGGGGCEQFFGEVPVKFFGRSGIGLPGCGDFPFDAQAYLIELPVLEPGGEQLVGQGSLFTQQLQREEILERVGGSRLGGVESHPGDDTLQRF